jgi:hypothetical protein
LQGDLMAIKKSNFACVYMQNISQYDSSGWCGPLGLLLLFWYYLPLEKSDLFHAFEQTWNPSRQGWFVPSLVKIPPLCKFYLANTQKLR